MQFTDKNEVPERYQMVPNSKHVALALEAGNEIARIMWNKPNKGNFKKQPTVERQALVEAKNKMPEILYGDWLGVPLSAMTLVEELDPITGNLVKAKSPDIYDVDVKNSPSIESTLKVWHKDFLNNARILQAHMEASIDFHALTIDFGTMFMLGWQDLVADKKHRHFIPPHKQHWTDRDKSWYFTHQKRRSMGTFELGVAV